MTGRLFEAGDKQIDRAKLLVRRLRRSSDTIESLKKLMMEPDGSIASAEMVALSVLATREEECSRLIAGLIKAWGLDEHGVWGKPQT